MTADQRSVELFQQYLRIRTEQPKPLYYEAADFLVSLAKELGLQSSVFEPHPLKPVVIITWIGKNPDWPSLLLNSHTDVVPVFEEHWKYPPFSAHKDELGNIYARGAQDMKCVGMQYVEAIRRLKAEGKQFARTIHMSFVPDEEVTGLEGMQKLIKREEFRKLNVGFSLDEGIASENGIYTVFYGERSIWWMDVICPGSPGHGSKFIKNTAGEKLEKVISKMLAYREEQRKKLEANPSLTIGDVTTINLTKVKGGVQSNVVPSEMIATFDVRITPAQSLEEFDRMINGWMKEISPDIRLEFEQKNMNNVITRTDEDFPWWKAFKTAVEKQGLPYTKEIFTGGTDSRFLRQIGIPALGFSPIINHPQLLHDHNEYLNEKSFIRGIEIYQHIISALADVPNF